MNAEAIAEWMVLKVAEHLDVQPDQVDHNVLFTSLGLDSLTLFGLTGDLAEWLDFDLSASLVWEYPTIGELARHLEVASEVSYGTSIPIVSREQPLRLSFPQEKTWRCDKYDKRCNLNHSREQWKIIGNLNLDALRRSLNEMVSRHEILRTTFADQGGIAVQIVNSTEIVNLSVVDLSGDISPSGEAAYYLKEEYQCGMNLIDGPLFKVFVFKLSDSEHRIAFLLHHLLYDALSLNIFYEELCEFYTAFSMGEAPSLAGPLLQMADFAAWQREWLRPDGESYTKTMSWWMEYWSAPLPPRLKLPCAWERAPKTVPLGPSIVERALDPVLLEGVNRLARSEGVTTFALFFAIFQVLLGQMTGQKKMVLGIYVSDRSRSDVKRSIGFFINHLMLRADLSGQLNFIKFLARVSETLEKASVHQELPFLELCAELKKRGRKIPKSKIIFQKISQVRLLLPRLKVEQWVEPSLIKIPTQLVMEMVDTEAGVRAQIRFNPAQYDPSKMADMLQQYFLLLERFVANPEDELIERDFTRSPRWWPW